MSLADPVVNIIGWCYHVVDLHYSCYNEFYSVDKITCENITGRHCIPHIICQIPPALSFLWTENTQHCAADTKLTRYKKHVNLLPFYNAVRWPPKNVFGHLSQT